MQQTTSSFPDYMALYEQQLKILRNHWWGDMMLEKTESVRITWRISYLAVRDRDEAAFRLLHLWAFLSNKRLWFDFLGPASTRLTEIRCIPEWFRRITRSQIAFARTTGYLSDLVWSRKSVVHQSLPQTPQRIE